MPWLFQDSQLARLMYLLFSFVRVEQLDAHWNESPRSILELRTTIGRSEDINLEAVFCHRRSSLKIADDGRGDTARGNLEGTSTDR